MSALEMFAAKPSASKNEKGNSRKLEDAPDDKDDKVHKTLARVLKKFYIF